MKTANAIKKMQTLPNFKDDGRKLSAQFGAYVVNCSRNGGPDATEVVCFHSGRVDDITDITTDYFGGAYHDNLTQAIRSAKNSADREAKDMAAGVAAAQQLGEAAPATRMQAYKAVDRLRAAERQALSLQEA